MKKLFALSAAAILAATGAFAGSAFGNLQAGAGGAFSNSTSASLSASGSFGPGAGSSTAEAGGTNFSGVQNTFTANGFTSETINESATYSNFENTGSALGGSVGFGGGNAWGAGGTIGGSANWGW